MRQLQLVVLLASLVLQSSIALAQTPPPSIYIGPQIRDGFADIDSGIRDSIRDLQTTFRTENNFMLEQDADESWRECHLHARNLLGEAGYQQILQDIEAEQRGDRPQPAEPAASTVPVDAKAQGTLFN